ncbi:hypothetical protein M231_06401 [Tremella mesenterica]|uniref:Proteophosphoglycan ppg4 n=1 Tax=Tremella mesenterica TaxID=5217 RepID=A0A4Q1BEB0_TREME|nr:hypothetical protein M231_06401 [Tremella mesenterica]
MLLASRSTAPSITSPLLAWPSQPSARSSPLSTPSPSSDTFDHDLVHPRYANGSSSSASLATFGNARGMSMLGDREAGSRSSIPFTERTNDQQFPEMPVVRIEDEDMVERKYGPPSRPLSPHQLGRIAQSFGIVMPNLPRSPSFAFPSLASPTLSAVSTGSSRHNRFLPTPVPARTPYLLTVIPPAFLLPNKPSTSNDAEQRVKRWKRGRLLALQPTLEAMLNSIAREYGLPSTTGISLFLAQKPISKGKEPDSSSLTSLDSDDPGPLISSSTWSTLFSIYLHSNPSSRSSTPAHTPVKGQSPFARDLPFPASPLSLIGTSNKARLRGASAEPQPSPTKKAQPRSAEPAAGFMLDMPPTPASTGMTTEPDGPSAMAIPVVGAVEFDIDPDVATWFTEWRRTGVHRRKASTLSETSGLREFRLRRSTPPDVIPRFLRELETHPSSSSGTSDSPALEDDDSTSSPSASLEPHSIEQNERLADLFPSAASEFAALRASRTSQEHRLSIQDIEVDRAVSASASMSYFTDVETSSGHGNGDNGEKADEEVMEMLTPLPNGLHHGDFAQMQRQIIDDGDKRGSGLVMSEQLDTLEKIMRQLSPREIRLTSPREMTPRMASKIAHLQYPAPPGSKPKPASSPLANGFTDSPPHPSSKHRFSLAPAFEPTTQVRSPSSNQPPSPSQEQLATLQDSPRPSWPTVPFSRPELPASPDINKIFVVPTINGLSSPISVSDETLRRMQVDSPPDKPSEWRPRRPQRPPSPNLHIHRPMPQSLSPELVHILRSPEREQTSPNSVTSRSPNEREKEKEKEKDRRRLGRTASVSLKGLRQQMSAKNLNVIWKRDDNPVVPSLPSRSVSDSQPVGLFKNNVNIDSEISSFPSSLSSNSKSPTEAKQYTDLLPSPTSPSSITTSTKTGGFSRILQSGFSFHRKAISVDKRPDKRVSKNTSNGPKDISAPILSSFQKVSSDQVEMTSPRLGPTDQQSTPKLGHSPRLRQTGLPTSPASPKNLRRKPVPTEGNVKESRSLASMASFVLDDPPKRRQMQNGQGREQKDGQIEGSGQGRTMGLAV